MEGIDGKHRLDGKTKRNLTSVLVTPLSPPFTAPWRNICFASGERLAVSVADAKKIEALLDARMEGQEIVLSGGGDSKHIKISLGEEE